MKRSTLVVPLFAASWLAATALAAQESEPDVQEAVDSCRALEDPLRRLACYDRIPGDTVTGQDELVETLDTVSNAPVPTPVAKAVDETPITRSRMIRRWELDDATHGGLARIRRHAPVYLLPARWSSNLNRQPSTPTRPTSNRRVNIDPTEVKFQLSLRTKLADNLIGDNGDLWVGYTQQSNWQAYNSVESAPFRETNYEPEVILSWRTGLELFGWRWQMVNFGVVHQSNGRSEALSRSWNRAYALFGIERGNLSIRVRPWLRVEPSGDDDNPDIEEYLGHGDLRVNWRRGGHDIGLLARLNRGENRGALQADWHFPLTGDIKVYLQVFHGYGETLIDYNHRQTTIGLGISLVQ